MVSLKWAITLTACVACTAAVDITVGSSGGNETSGHQYGFLHEDINNSGDGGIYAELVRNRAFQFSEEYPVSLDGYRAINGAHLSIRFLQEPLSDALPASMRVRTGMTDGVIGFQNDGYWGMNVERQKYTGSFWVRGAYDGHFTASLRSNLTSAVFGSVKIPSKAVAGDWTEHQFELTPKRDAPNSNNTLAITFNPPGTANGYLDFNLISLFPPTFKGRENGLRVDVAEALYQMNPTFFRFPGGNMLEGNTNKSYWDWKDSIGPLRYRPGFPGVWGYQQTHGLGLMEYLEWAEDFGMEIVVAVYAGLSLNGDITPRNELQPFIDDALNEIEFIRGPADSTWGSRRAELGHPEPFKLNYVEVGNEDWLAGGPEGWRTYKQYRFPMFLKAINAAYPVIQVIASGATTDGYIFPPQAYGDYHPYREPDALVEEFDRFDNETLTHIVGEVAATHVNGGIGFEGDLYYFPWWIGSVGEAVSLIGYERNSDRVRGTFYAPVLRNMNRWQWSVTLVQFAADPALTTRSTSWYVWSLFAHHPISHTLPVSGDLGPVYFGAGKDEARDAMVWKGAVYNTTDSQPVPISVHFEGVKPNTPASLTILTNPSGDPFAVNDPFSGVNIVDTSTNIVKSNRKGVFEFNMPELSVAVLDTDCSS